MTNNRHIVCALLTVAALLPMLAIADPVGDFFSQLGNAVKKGVEDGLNKANGNQPRQVGSNSPTVNKQEQIRLINQRAEEQRRLMEQARNGSIAQQKRSTVGSVSIFNSYSSGISAYSDPGPDQTLAEDTSRVAVGNFRRSGTGAQTPAGLTFVDDEVLVGPVFGKDLVQSSLQWSCFGNLRSSDKPYFLQELMGAANPADLRRRNQPNGRAYRIKQINGWITNINRILSGKDPMLEMERRSTVYGTDQQKRARALKIAQMQSQERLINFATQVAAEIVALNPNSLAAGKKAIDVLQTVVEKADQPASQQALCLLNYLEDRYSDKSDGEILARYEKILAAGADKASQTEFSAMNCPIALSVASKYVAEHNFDAAHRVISLVRSSAKIRFPPSDMRARIWPTNSCQYVHWLDGMLSYHGLGTLQSPTDASDAFRNCSKTRPFCAYNLAYLVGYGQTQAASSNELKEALGVAVQSSDPDVSQRANAMLTELNNLVTARHDAQQEKVCAAAGNASGKDPNEPTAAQMCRAYVAYVNRLIGTLNNMPDTFGAATGTTGILALAKALQGGDAIFLLTGFDKKRCEPGGDRYQCTFEQNGYFNTEHGPLSNVMGIPLIGTVKGAYVRTADSWRYIAPPKKYVAPTKTPDYAPCLDPTLLSIGEMAAGSIGGGHLCD